jgi:hypothetical protein
MRNTQTPSLTPSDSPSVTPSSWPSSYPSAVSVRQSFLLGNATTCSNHNFFNHKSPSEVPSNQPSSIPSTDPSWAPSEAPSLVRLTWIDEHILFCRNSNIILQMKFIYFLLMMFFFTNNRLQVIFQVHHPH